MALVEKKIEIDFRDLLEKLGQIEERIYRFRCVEAWAMTLPWSGFHFSKLIDFVKPLNNAKFVKFETFLDTNVARGQKQNWYPWPYTEGLTLRKQIIHYHLLLLVFMVKNYQNKMVRH